MPVIRIHIRAVVPYALIRIPEKCLANGKAAKTNFLPDQVPEQPKPLGNVVRTNEPAPNGNRPHRCKLSKAMVNFYFWNTNMDSHRALVRCCFPLHFSGLSKTRALQLAIEKLVDPEIKRKYQNRLLERLPGADLIRKTGSLIGPCLCWKPDDRFPPGRNHNSTRQIIRRQVKLSVRADRSLVDPEGRRNGSALLSIDYSSVNKLWQFENLQPLLSLNVMVVMTAMMTVFVFIKSILMTVHLLARIRHEDHHELRASLLYKYHTTTTAPNQLNKTGRYRASFCRFLHVLWIVQAFVCSYKKLKEYFLS
ncbi:hypothetical protein CLF_110390 [Clonorchis sinensis]|uniref:Uncharacterized protein n=1 Tax=Clonorchis sinensis TaxID=79923 RepID=G7YTH4_CLOSI|nr:hypothetical protein CLF_110390 [Clonorchis sinensis]